MGGNSFSNVRSPNQCMAGGRAHLPECKGEYKGVSGNMSKSGLLLRVYRFLQAIHRLTRNFNRKEPVENPTEDLDLVIWAGYQVIYGPDCCCILARSDELESVDQVGGIVVVAD
jgi:hypothetical protein